MKFHITASSRVGCVREKNEDMVLVDNVFVRNESKTIDTAIVDQDRYLLALADGMGGHSCGEVASSDVLHNLQFFYSDIPSSMQIADFNEVIYEWLNSMNNIIAAKGRVDPDVKNMGTTLVALAYYGGEFFWMNCGDSRLYRLHQGKLTQMTTDHSLSNLMGSKVHSHVITNCIGGGCTTSYIDIMRCTEEVEVGDMFLLCSDGLTDMVSDIELQNRLNDGATADDLCDMAEAAGGFDNVSAIVVKVNE